MASKVNLDALIPREDFEVLEDISTTTGAITATLDINGMTKGNLFYAYLRKPDFQRETSEWDAKKIVGLIQNFINGDLIPSLILWHSKGNYIFAIDGAHRISAILAWINDDYGDGEISKAFFETIPAEQIRIAQQARKIVNGKVGPYSHYKLAATNPKDVSEEIVKNSKQLAVSAFQVQWVPTKDPSVAERSFLTINQKATPVSSTERRLIEGRKRPNCITARAVRRSGMGHKYWSHFDDNKQDEIKNLAKRIHELIFVPQFKKPVKSIDFPIAGDPNGGQALQLILNFVNIANGIIDKKEEEVGADKDGTATIEYLQKCRHIAEKIRSNESFSLGLHPVVYFYSKEANYKVVSFYAVLDLMLEFDKNPDIQKTFISVRKDFEEFLLEYDQYISQIVRKYREGIKGYKYVKEFYVDIINQLSEKKSKEEVVKYLNEKGISKDNKEFSVDAKSEIVINDALKNAPRCKICNGLIDQRAISIDHINRKREGGHGNIENGQITHPYCNTTYKN